MKQASDNDYRNRSLNIVLATALGIGTGLIVGESTHNLFPGIAALITIYIFTWIVVDRMKARRNN